MTPGQARLLLSGPGRAAVAFAETQDLSPQGRLVAAEAVRAECGELGPAALAQALLRRRARAKHARGDELWWTAAALEQATSQEVAAWRGRQFDRPVLDLCCSVGGDLLELPAGSVGVDLDEARLLFAAANARLLEHPVQLVRADVTSLTLPGDRDVFVDPARRAGGRRVFDPRAYQPALDTVLSWRREVRSLTVKVAPGVDLAALPADIEVEVVSLRGEVKEAVLRSGAGCVGRRTSAVLLPAGDVLVGSTAAAPDVREPGPFLLEPDGAVVRAQLVAEVAGLVDGWLLDTTIAYVSAARPAPTPFGRWYEVLETLPFGLKRLRERLRAHDAGPLVVKKRGTAVEPETLRRQLKLTGSREVTVVLTRAQGRQVVLIVRALSPPRAGSAAPAPQDAPDAAGYPGETARHPGDTARHP